MPPKGKGGPGKSVRFSSGVTRKKKDDNHDFDGDDTAAEISRPKKRPRAEDHFQHDEDDEIEEWVNDEDDGVLPSERDLVNAKRNRRLKRQGQDLDDDDDDDGDDDTNVNNETSLFAENSDNDDIPVEPFNMKEESTDGSGYFDGDTYIFRKPKEAEPDAWLESLDEGDRTESRAFAKPKVNNEGPQKRDDMDDWTKEELYSRILPLVSDSETILQALVRYGNLIKRLPKGETGSLSQKALDELTMASNALLLQGDVDIYQKTREGIMEMVPDQADAVPTQDARPVVQWEYKGNQDGAIHGPYSTQDMLGWTQAGYFIGSQAVQIRTVSLGPASQASTQEELLSDLMDDDDNDDNRKASITLRGDWVSSNDVNFMAYS
jgi:CD2 antigen cytoplasmic tail-binding protein 2